MSPCLGFIVCWHPFPIKTWSTQQLQVHECWLSLAACAQPSIVQCEIHIAKIGIWSTQQLLVHECRLSLAACAQPSIVQRQWELCNVNYIVGIWVHNSCWFMNAGCPSQHVRAQLALNNKNCPKTTISKIWNTVGQPRFQVSVEMKASLWNYSQFLNPSKPRNPANWGKELSVRQDLNRQCISRF